MSDQHTSVRRSRAPQLLSTILFVAALIFAAAAAYIWYLDDHEQTPEAPVPTVQDGIYGLVNVLDAFKHAGLDADYGRTPPTAKANQLDVPGQNLRLGNTNVFVFIFNGATPAEAVAARKSAFQQIDPATLTLTTPSGRDVSQGKPLAAWEGGNVIVIMIGGDAKAQADVQRVIEGFH